jgi:Fe-S-cluster-containing dehydrogenase component
MSTYYLFQDKKKCIGCYSCAVACKANKSLLSASLKPTTIIPVGPKMVDGVPKAAYVFMPCFHCESPWCVAACPTGAMQRRARDGIVFVNPSLCVGCKSCMSACPWGAPQWNAETGKVVKCDYCMERLDQGFKPACVTVCTSHCLQFARAEEMPEVRRERYARAVADL